MDVAVKMTNPPKNYGMGFILKNAEYKAVTGVSRFYTFSLRGEMAHVCPFDVGMALKRKYGDLITVFNPETGDPVGEENAYKDVKYTDLKKELAKYSEVTDEKLPFVAKREVIEAKLVELKHKYGEL